MNPNHSYFTECILQMAATNRKLCYFFVWTPHRKVIDTTTFDDIMWKDINKKLVIFLERFLS